MQIFTIEINDGIEDIIKASASISYASLASPVAQKSVAFDQVKSSYKSLAGINDSDLYYVQSILVTSSWNKNDDIFDRLEVWNARATPMHKPTNLEHDEGTIIGHITSNWPMTEDGILIDENTDIDSLPDKFHILTGSVIYTAFTDPVLKDRSQKLISEIEDGTKYVSMECFFKGFDYGLINKSTGEYKVLARDEDTAYLTKYLRAYGGMGEHENYKIGRVLRNITFSGKGFVNRPANPESIIFTKESIRFQEQEKNNNSLLEKNTVLQEESVLSNQANIQEKNTMSLENELSELKTKIEAMQDCSQATKEAYAAIDQIKNTNIELESSLKAQELIVSQANTTIEALNTEKEEAAKKMNEEMMKKEEEMKKMKAELDEAMEVIAAYKNKEMEMMKKEKKMKRMAALLDGGIDTELASSTVDKFEAIDDDAFEAIAQLLVATRNAASVKEATVEVAPTEDSSASDATEALETAEPVEEISLTVGSDSTTEIENTRAALVDFVYNRLGKKLNKGE